MKPVCRSTRVVTKHKKRNLGLNCFEEKPLALFRMIIASNVKAITRRISEMLLDLPLRLKKQADIQCDIDYKVRFI